MGPLRKLISGNAEIIEWLTKLKETAPSFAPVIDIVGREARASMLSRGPMRLTPVILVGPPGYGKTYTARRIAAALGVPFVAIAMNTCDDAGGELCGHGLSWRGGRARAASRRPCLPATPLRRW